MSDETRDLNVLSTWTDQLNATLQPLGLLLSGVDAMSILFVLGRRPPLDTLRSLDEAGIQRLTDAANHYCETDAIEPSQIRRAVERTIWHWRDS